MDGKITEIRSISNELNGITSHGRLNEYKDTWLKPPRYMLILYAANDLVFEDLQDKSLKNSFTLPSLLQVAKFLQLDFDRSKTGPKIYEEKMKKGLVEIIKTDQKRGYKLTKDGEGYCERILSKLASDLKVNMNSNPGIYQFTIKATEKNKKDIEYLQKLSEEEQQKWLQKNPGKLFRQPTEDEALIEKMFKKFEELEQKYN